MVISVLQDPPLGAGVTAWPCGSEAWSTGWQECLTWTWSVTGTLLFLEGVCD